MSFKSEIEKRPGNVYVIKLIGRLDADTYLQLEETVKKIPPITTKALILDLAGLEYVNSSGLGVIFTARKTMEANKASFLMINLRPPIKKVFDIVKALPKQSIFENIEEADRYLDSMQKKSMEE